MRESRQQYKMADGSLRVLTCATADVPKGAILWNGYDYQNQWWVVDGWPEGNERTGYPTGRAVKPREGESLFDAAMRFEPGMVEIDGTPDAVLARSHKAANGRLVSKLRGWLTSLGAHFEAVS